MPAHLRRDWRAVYFAAHDRWAVDATCLEGDPSDDSDRFDPLDGELTAEEVMSVAAVWDLKAACAAVVKAYHEGDGGELHAAVASAEDALAKSESFVTLGTPPPEPLP